MSFFPGAGNGVALKSETYKAPPFLESRIPGLVFHGINCLNFIHGVVGVGIGVGELVTRLLLLNLEFPTFWLTKYACRFHCSNGGEEDDKAVVYTTLRKQQRGSRGSFLPPLSYSILGGNGKEVI